MQNVEVLISDDARTRFKVQFMYQDSIHANDVDWKPARFPGVYLVLTVFSAKLDVPVID